ncbi:MAG: CHASE2 domain-containing protein [Candidatus Delongbacteria bacterium]|nr:CHASE2 domain-containing protein [Candidatus Delongbacteria bacterium]
MKRYYCWPILVGLGLILFVMSAWYEELEYMVYDLKTRVLAHPITDSIEVIAITADDIQQAGQYPLSEDYLGLMLNSLEKAGVRQVMLDIYFSPYPSLLTEGSLLEQYLRIAGMNIVMGTPRNEPRFQVPPGINLKSGYSAINASRDGYVRMIPLDPQGMPFMTDLLVGGKKINPGKENLLVPPYRDLQDFKATGFFDALKLLDQPTTRTRYQGKIVYLGYHIPGVSPFFLNPGSDELLSGLTLQANFGNSAMTGAYCVKTPIWLDMVLTLVLMGLGAVLGLRMGAGRGWMMVALSWLGMTVINLICLKFGGLQVPLLYPALSLAVIYTMVYFIRSLTEEKRLRQELQSSNVLIQNVMRHFSGLAILFTPDCEIFYSNSNDAVSRKMIGSDKVRENLGALGHKRVGSIWWEEAENGRIHRFNLNLVPELKELAGQDVILLLSYDITENIELRNKLKEQEHLVSIGRMAAAIAHEIRNPLAGLELTAGTIRDKVKDRPEVATYVNNMNLAIKSLNRFISEFLEFSRSMKLNRIKMDLVRVIQDSLFMIDWSSKSITVEKHFPDKLEMMGDPDRLRQVVINVMNNAVQAIEEKGKISLELESGEREVLLLITDTGIGISDEDLPRVFDPFFTTRADGTGLGLAICRKIMELHDGSMVLESRFQAGTRVVMKLPIGEQGTLV